MKKTILMVLAESHRVIKHIETCIRCNCNPFDYLEDFEYLNDYFSRLPDWILEMSQNETDLSQNETFPQKRSKK